MGNFALPCGMGEARTNTRTKALPRMLFTKRKEAQEERESRNGEIERSLQKNEEADDAGRKEGDKEGKNTVYIKVSSRRRKGRRVYCVRKRETRRQR